MNQFITAFSTVFSDPMAFVLIFAGTVIGIIFGCIPGLTAGMAIALFLPLTFRMDIIPSLTLLLALYIGGISGGLISAILIKIPGTPASIATVFDGGPMADRGESWRALSVGIVFSFLGTLIGILILCCLAPVLGKFSLSLGMFEYFSVAVFSLTLVAVLCGTSLTKGLLACLIGLFMGRSARRRSTASRASRWASMTSMRVSRRFRHWSACSPFPNCSTAARKGRAA